MTVRAAGLDAGSKSGGFAVLALRVWRLRATD
jgi:hypothetical protein